MLKDEQDSTQTEPMKGLELLEGTQTYKLTFL